MASATDSLNACDIRALCLSACDIRALCLNACDIRALSLNACHIRALCLVCLLAPGPIRSRVFSALSNTLLYDNKLKGLAQKRVKLCGGSMFLFEDDVLEVLVTYLSVVFYFASVSLYIYINARDECNVDSLNDVASTQCGSEDAAERDMVDVVNFHNGAVTGAMYQYRATELFALQLAIQVVIMGNSILRGSTLLVQWIHATFISADPSNDIFYHRRKLNVTRRIGRFLWRNSDHYVLMNIVLTIMLLLPLFSNTYEALPASLHVSNGPLPFKRQYTWLLLCPLPGHAVAVLRRPP